ncbi:hypothetical protein BJX76DRAFT_362573 [Aspergillus varians]
MDRPPRMKASIQRRRLACAECTRKKIKCDKVVPCRNCTRRGHACYRITPATPGSSSQLHDESRPAADALEGNISSCIQELQATLRAVQQSQRSTPTASFPPSPAQRSARAESEGRETTLPEEIRPISGPAEDTTEVEDAATILEFLAWGRRKVQAYEDFDHHSDGGPAKSPGDVALDHGLDHDEAFAFDQRLTGDASSIVVAQLLLPEPSSLLQIVKYHCDCLLWYHGSFHALVFQNEVDDFLHQHNYRIDNPNVNLQWAALLFAVLAGSMTCAPPAVAHTWGFGDAERCMIARRWFKAALTCLHTADYTSNHSIYAIECIATMTISAHMLGHSNSQSVRLATAARIAQSLGLHNLGASSTQDTRHTVVRRETGRRVWTELCIQDWFSIPFSESYLIHLLDFNTALPMNCKDEDMTPQPDDTPTSMSYHRLLYQVASLMPQLQDDLAQSNTLYTKYEHVLRYDTKMRTFASKHVPQWLKNTPLDPGWPRYVPWARHCLTISSAHKIIMIHRKFLWPSFTNPAFSFTRKTCIAASKTIIRECKQVAHEDGPVLWIYHAFAVAASIILCLDLLFRPPSDAEHRGHRDLIQDTVAILSQNETSMIAKRGVTILRLLCRVEKNRRSSQEVELRESQNQPQHQPSSPTSPDEQRYALDIRKLVQAVCDAQGSELPQVQSSIRPARQRERVTEPPGQWPSSFAFQGRRFGGLLGPQSGLEINDSLEDILFLAQNCDPGYE